MVGTNELHLCPAAIIEAVQDYLDKLTKKREFIVKSVEQQDKSRYDGGHFVIKTVAPDETPEAA